MFPDDALGARRFLSEIGRIRQDQPEDVQEKELVTLVETLKRESEQSQKRRDSRMLWEQADLLFKGEHWNAFEQNMNEWQAKIIINRIYPIVQKQVSMQVEGLPELEVVPRTPHQDIFAREIDAFIHHQFQTKGWFSTIAALLKKVSLHTVAFIKVYWDRHADGGRGSAKLEPISNYDLFLHDASVIREGRLVAKYRIHRYVMSRNEILSHFGKDPEGEYDDIRKRGIVPQRNPGGMPLLNNRAGIAGLRYSNELNVGESYVPGQGGAVGGMMTGEGRSDSAPRREDGYEVLECLLMDDSRVEWPNFDDVHQQEPKIKYPHGRLITVCNGMLLADKPNPLGFDPYVPLCDDPDIDSVYGPSYVNQLYMPQMELNKLRSQVCDHTSLVSNPIMIIDPISGVTTDTITSMPGTKVVARRSQFGPGIEWLQPPELGDEVFANIGIVHQDMDEIAGQHEATRGAAPEQRTSGVAIEKYQMEGRTVTNLRDMHLDEGIKSIVENVISLYVDFVSDERKFKYVDPTDYEDEWGVFNPQAALRPIREEAIMPIQEEMAKLQQDLVSADMLGQADPQFINYTQSQIMMLDNQIRMINEMPGHELVDFDLIIQIGTRNFTAAAQGSLALQLYQEGILPRQTVLKTLNWPGWQKALALKAQEDQAAAEAEAEAAELEFQRSMELEREKNKMKAQSQNSSSSSSKKK